MLDIDFSRFPELQTKRLTLRELKDSDAAAVHHLRSSDDVMKFIAIKRSTSEQDAQDFIQLTRDGQAEETSLTWAMATRESPQELIGMIGLYRIDARNWRSEFGYSMSVDCWGQGFMSEATVEVLRFSFHQAGLHGLEAHADPRNKNSRNLLERNGFRYVGDLRDCIFFEGQFVSSAIYEMLAEDFVG